MESTNTKFYLEYWANTEDPCSRGYRWVVFLVIPATATRMQSSLEVAAGYSATPEAAQEAALETAKRFELILR